ncbi:hypothetical protein CLV30_10712 [Haloactinopolyspora alba]|uniref:UDP-N-acetylmuramyl pentapeptide phosphotransferase/UDP-N-acetylglucosamine-1-phosphate transferase n=1 Tax=Haloactinopolyspora alba TaxID=648780 RepID=A0A2P8E247_9ACTN|nr:hypothetical protein [Haloactinopolyspora alba]PSL03533.1 hypothetical protein CLV30_10712 [Haloactinopolyspora alba]
MSRRGLAAAALAAGTAAAVTWAVGRALATSPPAGRRRWERTNFRGSTVTLTGGPALVAGVTAGAALAPGVPRPVRAGAVGSCVAVGAIGLLDDLAPSFDPDGRWGRFAGDAGSKGLRGHVLALRDGEVTSGVLKIGVIGLAGAAGAALVSDNVPDAVIGGAAVAGHANVVNLLDLRPGRANKTALLHAPLVLRGPAKAVGAAALAGSVASLPDDLGERTMMGDCGANTLGALLGLAMVAREGRTARLVHLGVVTGLTLLSEKVSFTRVIESTPVLRELDGLGRRP